MTTTDDVQNGSIDWGKSLTHYGIKGMKWGVRRSERQLAKARKKAGLDPDSDDAARAKEVARKIQSNKGKTSSVSNAELRVLVDRMNLEKQYKTLQNQPKYKSEGRKFAESIAKDLARESIKGAAKEGIKGGTDRIEGAVAAKRQKQVEKALSDWDWKVDVTG